MPHVSQAAPTGHACFLRHALIFIHRSYYLLIPRPLFSFSPRDFMGCLPLFRPSIYVCFLRLLPFPLVVCFSCLCLVRFFGFSGWGQRGFWVPVALLLCLSRCGCVAGGALLHPCLLLPPEAWPLSAVRTPGAWTIRTCTVLRADLIRVLVALVAGRVCAVLADCTAARYLEWCL